MPSQHPSSDEARIPVSDAALQRALKRRVWPARWTFQAATAAGLEALLEGEVAGLLPGEPRELASGQVRVEAPFDAVYALALRLRSADALRIRLTETAAGSFPILRDHLGRVSWRWWLPEACRLQVEVRSRRSRLRDDAGLERTVRQSVRAQGIDDAASRPDAPALRLRLDLRRDRAEVWLDVAGMPLHRRTGRRRTVRGSLRETTAAALAMVAGAETADLIVDPFCGGGTVLEEAASCASGRCPGAARTFAMAASPAWSEARMRHARRSRCEGVAGARPALIGLDVSERAIAAARHNLEAADASERLELRSADARSFDASAAVARSGASRPMVLGNPPYGRIVDAHGAEPAALLGQVLASLPGWRFGLVFPDPEMLAALPGLQVERVVRFRMRGLPNALVSGRVEPVDRDASDRR